MIYNLYNEKDLLEEVPHNKIEEYKKSCDRIFGEGVCEIFLALTGGNKKRKRQDGSRYEYFMVPNCCRHRVQNCDIVIKTSFTEFWYEVPGSDLSVGDCPILIPHQPRLVVLLCEHEGPHLFQLRLRTRAHLLGVQHVEQVHGG